MKRATPAAALRATLLALVIATAALLLAACGQGNDTAPAATAVTMGAGAAILPTTLAAAAATATMLADATQISGSDGAIPQATAPAAHSTPTAPGAGNAGDAGAEAAATPAEEPSDAGFMQRGIDLTKVDVCKLLSEQEVTSVMGAVPVMPTPLTSDPDHIACAYVSPTLEENSPMLWLTLDIPGYWELHPSSAEDVTGIGDQAQTEILGGWRSLWVLLNKRAVVQVDIVPTDLEMAKQLAQLVMNRLP